jgi:hypothetical protein
LRRPAKRFPSLSSRLRVAVKASPVGAANQPASRAAGATKSSSVTAPVQTPLAFKPSKPPQRPSANSREAQAGLLLAATLAGWALVRRRTLSRNMTSGRVAAGPPKMLMPGKANA